MPELYNQQAISLLDSQTSNLPSGIISSDPKLTENVLGLVQNVPLPSVSEAIAIDQQQELEKPENSAKLLAIEPDTQPSKSYSSSLSETEKATSVDGITDDLLIGKVENSESQGLLGGEAGDTLIGTTGSDSSVKLSPEDTLLNNAEATSIKTEENQQVGGDLSSADSLQKPQVEAINSSVLLEENVELSQTTNVITLSAAAEDNPQQVQVEESVSVSSSVVKEEKKPIFQPEAIVVDHTEILENKSHTEQQQTPSESNQKPSETDPLPIKEENLLGVEEAISESLTDKLPELAVSSNLTENSLSEDQILPTTTNDISEESPKEPLTTTLSLTEIETNNKPIENSSSTAIALEETPSLTTKVSETTTELIPNSKGDELFETKEQLVTSSERVSEPKNTTDITTQLNSQESSEEVANKQSDVQTLTSSDPSVKDDREDAIAPSIAPVKSEEVEAFKSGVFTVGASGEVGIDFLYDGGWYQGQLAIFSLEGMEKYQPGSPEFIKEAALRAASNSELGYIAIDDVAEGARFIGALGETNHNSGEYKAVKFFKLRPESSFGIMLIPNNRVEEVAENPMVSGSARPLFSMTTANPNEAFHVGQIADVTGEGNTFVMEDMRADEWTDRDYNDLIFQVRGAIGKAALMDEVVAPEKDWRSADLGKALIAYAKAYLNPEPLEDEKSFIGDDLPTSIDSNQDINKAVPLPTKTTEEESVAEIGSPTSTDSNQDINKTAPIADKPTTEKTVEPIGEISSEPIVEPVKPIEIPQYGEKNNQLAMPAAIDINKNPVAITDILTGEKVATSPTPNPTPPTPTAPPVQFEFPKENQPLTGVIAAKDINGYSPALPAKEDATLWVSHDIEPQKWAESLVDFVNAAKQSGQPNAVVNLSIDLTQINPDGTVSPRSQLTESERSALTYAQQNNIVVVVPAGDKPGEISALGQFSREFDNILTVGAAERVNNSVAVSKAFAPTPSSGSGNALDILAEGNSDSLLGTTVAATKATSAVSQVWAANPQLDRTQVIDIVKRTATDLGKPNWDVSTGAGLLNVEAAVWLAKSTTPLESVAPLAPEQVATVNAVVQEVKDELYPEVKNVLEQLNAQLAELIGNPESVLAQPASDAPTEAEMDKLLAEWNAELDTAFAELTEDKFVDVDTLAGKFEFSRDKQPLVGVVDTGFAASNPDLDYSRITPGKDWVDGDENPLLTGGEGDDHGTKILEVIAATQNNGIGIDGVNDDAPIWVGRAVGSGNWADSLVEFVDAAKASKQPNAIVNLSFDLSKKNPNGSVTTRYEFTADERAAIEYARDNNVLIVTAAGNQGQAAMSALGKASQEFDNIITVGAADANANRADYSSYGAGLDIMAYGSRLDDLGVSTGTEELDLFKNLTPEQRQAVEQVMLANGQPDSSTVQIPSTQNEANASQAVQQMLQTALESLEKIDNADDALGVNAIAGTSIAAAKVTGAASQVWAANPNLNFAQVKEILKASAVDLDTPGWDTGTGAGLLNLGLAVQMALVTEPEAYTPEIIASTGSVGGGFEGQATPGERPAFFKKLWNGVKKVFNTVVRIVNTVVSVVQKVIDVVKKVTSFISKAIPIIKKIASFFTSVVQKFICLPILGKIGIVLGGVALVGAAIGGIFWWLKNKKQKQQEEEQQQVVVVQEDPMVAKINALKTAWSKLDAQQKNDLRSDLLNGIPDKYKPLFNGDPDNILVLINAVNSLTQEQKNQLSGFLIQGVAGSWRTFFDGTNPSNSDVPQAVKDAWNSLTVTPEEKDALKNALLNGVTSNYGRPILQGDPEAARILKVASVLNSPSLTEQDKGIIANFLLNEPGGVPDQYHNLFF